MSIWHTSLELQICRLHKYGEDVKISGGVAFFLCTSMFSNGKGILPCKTFSLMKKKYFDWWPSHEVYTQLQVKVKFTLWWLLLCPLTCKLLQFKGRMGTKTSMILSVINSNHDRQDIPCTAFVSIYNVLSKWTGNQLHIRQSEHEVDNVICYKSS